MLKQTPLYNQHIKLGAKMVPFAGWEMPVSYPAGILAEHAAVRTSAGLFDIGHMGLIKIEGEDALLFLQKVTTNDASMLAFNQCQYSVFCNENGGAIDDVLVYRLPMHYLIICNASNTDKVLAWLEKQAANHPSLNISLYENYCTLSIQGPKALAIVEKVLSVALSVLKHNHTLWWRDIVLSRTGYTGEDGIEMIVAKKEAEKVWASFINAGVQPCGLGARDTLRLEAGLPLYSHEYNEETSPLEVGYSWAVNFNKGGFIGREALLKQKENGLKKKLVGLEIEGRAIARQGDLVIENREQKAEREKSRFHNTNRFGIPAFDKVESSGQGTGNREQLVVGKVSSGTFSPTFKKPIALAFLVPDQSQVGNQVKIKVRESLIPAQVVAKAFYKR